MDGKISSYKSEQQWDETGHTPSLQLDETAIDKIEQFSR